MRTRWDIGDTLRVVRNVRNDGTWPGADTGALLVRRGSVGTVVDIGTFLQDQVIYSLHFLDTDRIVGCREEELIGADEAWAPSVFEFRQRVVAAKTLAAAGKTLVPAGGAGGVLKVVQQPEGFACHVHFDCQPGRVFVVPESALAEAGPAYQSSASASAPSRLGTVCGSQVISR
ncbi:MAG: nitrogen fixation protein NifZ [Candidatus Nitricoxidivorans perseverans]|uniref:Nitrogen fixation protein NifZ n=1 Tax=Candidatus Nitricoxidivorans perseverans TaxID=2975601 RepID=A0AA49FMP1_9PROT|nr:MAG: nitrogen fixation protein NifZ [Candidatus Nitricoxidivorans perseverans]